jgi:hypothetical protein
MLGELSLRSHNRFRGALKYGATRKTNRIRTEGDAKSENTHTPTTRTIMETAFLNNCVQTSQTSALDRWLRPVAGKGVGGKGVGGKGHLWQLAVAAGAEEVEAALEARS